MVCDCWGSKFKWNVLYLIWDQILKFSLKAKCRHRSSNMRGTRAGKVGVRTSLDRKAGNTWVGSVSCCHAGSFPALVCQQPRQQVHSSFVCNHAINLRTISVCTGEEVKFVRRKTQCKNPRCIFREGNSMSHHINTSQSEKSAKPWIGSLFWKLVRNQCEATQSLN